MEKKYFYLGLIIFYFTITFAPNKLIYFLSFIIAAFFFYLCTKNLKKSLLYTLILSIFSDVNIASSWFIMQPKELNLDAGYWISPLTLFTLFLLLSSLLQKKSSNRLPDVLIILFLAWSAINFFIYPHTNVFYGIILLTETVLFYFILRSDLEIKSFSKIFTILITTVTFNLLIGLSQLILQRPVGLTTEVETIVNPYGTVAVEDVNLFRLSGTFWHPNFFASFLITFLPFVFFINTRYPLFNLLLKILISIVIVFTQSRMALLLLVAFYLMYAYENRVYLTSRLLTKIKSHRTFLVASLITIMASFSIVLPYVFLRLNTVPEAFDDPGSMTTRFKLAQEAFSLISQYPLTGVGLNRSLEFYAANPVTNIFQNIRPSSFYKIHNLMLEIASETGIIGLMFFLLFVFSVIKKYLHDRNKKETLLIKNFRKACFYGLMLWLAFASFNPFLHTSQMRYFVLLSALLMI